MQFQLPSNLQTELLAYDPKLKALAKQAAPNKPTKKPKYPLGNIPHLIPYDVIRQSDQQDAIDYINTKLAPERIRSFTTPVDVATPQARLITKAVIYHYEQCWYACWLPPAGKEDEYVYGHAYCFKDTATARKVVPRTIMNALDICTRTEVGRSLYYHYARVVTKEDIINGYSESRWRPDYFHGYASKTHEHIGPGIRKFEERIKETVPSWDDERAMFARLECGYIAKAIPVPVDLLDLAGIEDKRKEWLPNCDSLVELAVSAATSDRPYLFDDFLTVNKVLPILGKPFFRKWINSKCQESIDAFNDPDNRYRKNISAPWKQIFKLVRSIATVNSIWPDCPIDYYQTHIDALLGLYISHYSNNAKTDAWLNEHMPVASFFQIIDKYYTESIANKNAHKDTDLNINVARFYEWSDTYSMITRILSADQELAPPKRWRISEFHDYVQAENWKIVNPNEKLHQDLFPEPIKVMADGKPWTFFQPHDTHQLALWGQAVRNCVGSASHYAADIKKRKHFIVLAMIDGKPSFTIQLKVDMGVMSVAQIAGLSNARLNDDERELYTEAFQLALQERESQLKS